MISIDYATLVLLARPEIILVVAALIVLALDVSVLRKAAAPTRFAVASLLGIAGCAAAIASLTMVTAQSSLLDGVLLTDPTIRFVQIAILVLSIVALLLSARSTFTSHIGEFVLLILLATTGMLFLVATHDLLVIFLSLETLSLSLYIMAAFHKPSARSAKASLQYFLFGGMSAAFLLFGFSLLYGLSNSTNLLQIASAIHTPLNPLLIVVIVTTLIGLGFKVAAAPLHFWAPGVYQDAPTASAAFIASGSKVASFFVFFQLMCLGFAGAEGSAGIAHFVSGWVPVLALMAIASMVLGNLVAIVQTTLRRLVAWSAIAHAGYILLAIVAHSPTNLGPLLYYIVTYALGTLGIFTVLQAVEGDTGSDSLACYDGLSRRAPFLSACLSVFLLSLAGIPPLAGFFAKFYLFVSVIAAHPGSKSMLWLVILAIAMSAVSLYYYLRVMKRMYVVEAGANAAPLAPQMFLKVLAGLLAALIIVLGCAPHLLLRWIPGGQ
jgi:NADH-quinone oxidoreductase subunit N